MGIKYDKWTTLETHVDDKTESSYTKGFVVGYRLVQLTDGKQIRSDKQAKHGTTVRGIVKRSGSQPALFIIKEGKVTSNDEITGEYEMIGVGLRLQTVTLINSRNAEREQYQIGENADFTIDVRDDTQHNISNCTVDPTTGQLVDAGGTNVPEFNPDSTHVFDGGLRMTLGTDYTETPGSGKIVPITFTPSIKTVVDCDRAVNATEPAAMTYEKVP
jgi:hypothetical protein